MSHLHLDVDQIAVGRIADFAAGTLVMVPTETSSSPGPFWGIRFDAHTEENPVPAILWLSGMPWHGEEQSFYGMPIGGTGYGELNGVSCGVARLEVDLNSGVGGARREMRWDQSPGFVVAGANGTYLLGSKSARHVWGAHYAIELHSFGEVLDAHRDAAIEWFARWSVVVETKRGALVLPFEARSKSAGRAA